MRNRETNRPEVDSKTSSRWFDILAFPKTPDGFRLNLTANTPRHIARRHRLQYTGIVERLRTEKEGKPGYHDGTKVNIHPTFDPEKPGIIFYTATPTTYSDFLALSERKIPKTLQEQIRLSGVQALWLTTEPDGSQKAVFEIRSKYSGIYPGVPGTIGGSIDGKLDYVGSLGESARLADASPHHIVKHALRETYEELGIPLTTLDEFQSGTKSLTVNGVVYDRKRRYFDIALAGTLPYSKSEIQAFYEQHKAAGNDNIHDPMPTRLAFVEATPTSFADLLTKHLIPLTPVTQASFLLAGYMLRMKEVLQETGSQEEALQQAILWKNGVMAGMTQKDMIIDERARTDRKKILRKRRSAFWTTLFREPFKGDINGKYQEWRETRKRSRGYDTTLMPEEQGLQPVVEELRENKLH